MKKTYKYFFSIGALLLITCNLWSQSYRIKGLRLGYDLSRYALYYFDPSRKAHEFSGDFEIKRDLYIVGEYGMETVNLEKETFKYYSDGYYARLGVDKNFLKSENPAEYEMVFGGVRYGFASQNHSADEVVTQNPYWNTYTMTSIAESKYNTHWLEFVAGIRAELFRNVYVGWSLRGRIRLAHTKNSFLESYNVPGYGNGMKKASLGFNFSVYYKIPFYRQTVDYKKATP